MSRESLSHTVLSSLLVFSLLGAGTALAQNTAFTYQGKLSDATNPANGSFDMLFKLFDTFAAGAGTQHGSDFTDASVVVSNGIFTVQLDFGACATCFDGSQRYLEIRVRPSGSANPYSVLAPRQPITSTPYAVRSRNAFAADGLSVARVNCVTSSQNLSIEGAQITGALPVESVPTGSANYIQNAATLLKAGKNAPLQVASFNIDGDGAAGGTLTANVIDAVTQYNIASNRVLTLPNTTSLYVGREAGQTASGSNTVFVGRGAGKATAGSNNTFVGAFSGNAGDSSTCNNNSFFGSFAGNVNTTGSNNSFFGSSAGLVNGDGINNSFFGNSAGLNTFHGNNNSFFGSQTGQNNSSGSNLNVSVLGTLFIGPIQTNPFAGDQLCQGPGGRIGRCLASSLRFKKEVRPLFAGLETIKRLRPITFAWKYDNARDLGLGAENVAEVEPLLVMRNSKGDVDGVKYPQLSVVLINAIKEQQAQIEQQRREIDQLKQLICALRPKAKACTWRRKWSAR